MKSKLNFEFWLHYLLMPHSRINASCYNMLGNTYMHLQMSVQLFNSCGCAVSPHTIYIVLTNSLNLRQASLLFFKPMHFKWLNLLELQAEHPIDFPFSWNHWWFCLDIVKKYSKLKWSLCLGNTTMLNKTLACSEKLTPIIAWN